MKYKLTDDYGNDLLDENGCVQYKEENMHTILNRKESKRYDVLYELAVNRYLDKTDFDPTEWLSDNDSLELETLIKKAQGE